MNTYSPMWETALERKNRNEKGIVMTVNWHTDFDEALALAGRENRFILLDFFNPG